MHNKWIQRLTLALAATALFAAAGGPSYAAKKVKTISGSKITKNSISETKLTAKARASLKGNAGPQGAPGAKGADGAPGSAAAYASIDGFGSASIQNPYRKNVTSVNKIGTGRYCLYVDWAAAGRTPANQGTPVIAGARSVTQQASADQYNTTCPGDGIIVSLNNSATSTTDATAADGWVHVIIP